MDNKRRSPQKQAVAAVGPPAPARSNWWRLLGSAAILLLILAAEQLGEQLGEARSALGPQRLTLPQQWESAGAPPLPPPPPVPLQVPKVALLFLTRGPMSLENVWTDWLDGVRGLLPVEQLTRLGCHQGQVELARAYPAAAQAKLAGVRSSPVYREQYLFSVYLHAPPNHQVMYRNGSLFHGRRIPQQVETSWGNTIGATRHLLREALRDPLNQRFMLLSESDVPLWPAGLTYLQLMGEPLSRVSACAPPDAKAQKGLGLKEAAQLNWPLKSWRKNHQWFVISRHHARLFAEEDKVYPIFEKYCFVSSAVKSTGQWKQRQGNRWCLADEHYLSTMLAAKGEEGGCACSLRRGYLGSPMYNEWNGTPHPKTFTSQELGGNTIRRARVCPAAAAQAALGAYHLLLAPAEGWTEQVCNAAKVDVAAAAAVAQAALEADAALWAQRTAADHSNQTQAAEAQVAPAAGAHSSGMNTAVAAADTPAADTAAVPAVSQPLLGREDGFGSGVALLPPYRCYMALRKVRDAAAQALLVAARGGGLYASE